MSKTTEDVNEIWDTTLNRVDGYFKELHKRQATEHESARTDTLAPGVVNALNGVKTAMVEFKDAVRDAEDAGLTPIIAEMLTVENLDNIGMLTPTLAEMVTVENLDRIGMLSPDPEPEPDPEPDPEPVTITADTAADAFIHGMASVLSAAECREAERENPQPEITEPDPLKARIIGMLTENTGCDILDSGGAYGRQWQKNRHVDVDAWDKNPACTIEVYSDTEVTPTYDVYHYLVNFLSITDESEELDAILQELVSTSEEGYITDMETFLERKDVEIEGYALHNIMNTYNGESMLSQVLQYAVFEVDGDPFIMLQIHGGCDIRGGYTCPQIFALDEPDYFIMASQDVTATCGCSDWYSDDAGCHYYKDGSCPSPDPNWQHNPDNNTITCRECGKQVEFYVTESV